MPRQSRIDVPGALQHVIIRWIELARKMCLSQLAVSMAVKRGEGILSVLGLRIDSFLT